MLNDSSFLSCKKLSSVEITQNIQETSLFLVFVICSLIAIVIGPFLRRFGTSICIGGSFFAIIMAIMQFANLNYIAALALVGSLALLTSIGCFIFKDVGSFVLGILSGCTLGVFVVIVMVISKPTIKYYFKMIPLVVFGFVFGIAGYFKEETLTIKMLYDVAGFAIYTTLDHFFAQNVHRYTFIYGLNDDMRVIKYCMRSIFFLVLWIIMGIVGIVFQSVMNIQRKRRLKSEITGPKAKRESFKSI